MAWRSNRGRGAEEFGGGNGGFIPAGSQSLQLRQMMEQAEKIDKGLEPEVLQSLLAEAARTLPASKGEVGAGYLSFGIEQLSNL